MIGRTLLSQALVLVGIMGLAAAMAIGGPIPVGSLVGSKNATLDGKIPLPHTTVLSGDSVRVNDGLALVTLDRGNRMLLGRRAEASFQGEADAVTVSLTRGAMSLFHPAAGTGFRVKIDDVTVAPAHGHRTLGDIATVDGLLLVTVKDGALQVEKAGVTKELGKGKTMTIATTTARVPTPDSPKNRNAKHTLHHEAAGLEALAAAGVGAAIVTIALTRSSKQVSPVTPTP